MQGAPAPLSGNPGPPRIHHGASTEMSRRAVACGPSSIPGPPPQMMKASALAPSLRTQFGVHVLDIDTSQLYNDSTSVSLTGIYADAVGFPRGTSLTDSGSPRGRTWPTSWSTGGSSSQSFPPLANRTGPSSATSSTTSPLGARRFVARTRWANLTTSMRPPKHRGPVRRATGPSGCVLRPRSPVMPGPDKARSRRGSRQSTNSTNDSAHTRPG